MRCILVFLLLAGSGLGMPRYVNSVAGENGRAKLVDEAGGANVVYVIGDGSGVIGVADSGLGRYEEVGVAGAMSVWVALGVEGGGDTVAVNGAQSFVVAQYEGVNSVKVYTMSGQGFSADMFVSASGSAALSWALDVYSPFSWPFRGPEVKQSLLNGKFILGDNAIGGGTVELVVPISSVNAVGGAFHMIAVEMQ